jgi:hypothetical protein
MNKSYAALALAGLVWCTSMTAVAGADAPSTMPGMGAPPSQTGADPRTMGSDTSRQGVDNGTGNRAGSSMGAGSMGNGTQDADKSSTDAQLPGGDAAGAKPGTSFTGKTGS